jgi:hypothetical protein
MNAEHGLLIALRALNWAAPVERTCGAVELFKAKNNSTLPQAAIQQRAEPYSSPGVGGQSQTFSKDFLRE